MWVDVLEEPRKINFSGVFTDHFRLFLFIWNVVKFLFEGREGGGEEGGRKEVGVDRKLIIHPDFDVLVIVTCVKFLGVLELRRRERKIPGKFRKLGDTSELPTYS